MGDPKCFFKLPESNTKDKDYFWGNVYLHKIQIPKIGQHLGPIPALCEEFLLAEDVDSQEETADESDQVIEDVLVRLVCRPSFVCRRRLPSSSLS